MRSTSSPAYWPRSAASSSAHSFGNAGRTGLSGCPIASASPGGSARRPPASTRSPSTVTSAAPSSITKNSCANSPCSTRCLPGSRSTSSAHVETCSRWCFDRPWNSGIAFSRSASMPSLPGSPTTSWSQPRWERVARRDGVRELGLRSVGHDDLLVGEQLERCRVPGRELAVNVHPQAPLALRAVAADARRREPHPPHVEELAQRERPDGRRLDVDDPACVVRVQRGEHHLRTGDDPDLRRNDLLRPVP